MVSRDCLSNQQLCQLLAPDHTADRGAIEATAGFERHIETCQTCRMRLEELAGAAPPSSSPDYSVPVDTGAMTDVIRQLCELRPTIATALPLAHEYQHLLSRLRPSDHPSHLGWLGTYEIIRVIGSGGMGTVLEAIDPKLNRRVAIKVPSFALMADDAARDRFVREARALAAVKHHGIVTIHAVEEHRGLPYMIMEYVEGVSLARRLESGAMHDCSELVRIASEIADALAAAHRCGVIHRDIKPGNVLLEGPEQRVKVTDFGLARFVADPSMSASGLVAGTPEFMAPEQAAGEEVTVKSDLFSLGVVMYAALAGGSPFRGRNPLSTIRRVCSETPPSLSRIDARVPAWLDALVLQLLSKDPALRPDSAADVAHALRAGLPSTHQHPNPHPAKAGRQPTVTPQRRYVGLAGVLLVLASVGAWLLQRGAGDSPTTEIKRLAEPAEKPGFYVDGNHEPCADFEVALTQAPDGGRIRIVGDGPFIAAGYDLGDKSVAIEAAEGFSPSFVARSPGLPQSRPFLRTRGKLQLHGLDIHWAMKSLGSGPLETREQMCAILVKNDLEASHCSFTCGRMTCCLGVIQGAVTLDGCYLTSLMAPTTFWDPREGATLLATNCVFNGRVGITCDAISDLPRRDSVTASVVHNTFVGERAFQLVIGPPYQGYRVLAERNLFDVDNLVTMVPRNLGRPARRPPIGEQTRRLIENLFLWNDHENVYREKTNYLTRGQWRNDNERQHELTSLADWLNFWQASDTGSWVARIEYPRGRFGEGLLSPQITGERPSSTSTDERFGADPSRVGSKKRTE